jgi:hypothetical protein
VKCVYTTISEVLYSRRRTFSLYFIFRVHSAIDDIIILLHYKNEELCMMLKIGSILNDSNFQPITIIVASYIADYMTAWLILFSYIYTTSIRRNLDELIYTQKE